MRSLHHNAVILQTGRYEAGRRLNFRSFLTLQPVLLQQLHFTQQSLGVGNCVKMMGFVLRVMFCDRETNEPLGLHTSSMLIVIWLFSDPQGLDYSATEVGYSYNTGFP